MANSPAATSPFAGESWYQKVAAQFDGIPEATVWGPIMRVESQGNPKAQGDFLNGVPYSFGLFQLFTRGGLGDSYKNNTAALYDPELNAKIAAASIRPVYQEAVKKGLSGYALTEYVAAHAGFPTQNGNMPNDYKGKLMAAYATYNVDPASIPTNPTPGSNPLPGVSAGVEKAASGSPLLSALRSLSETEAADISILKPAESAKKIGVLVLLAVLGLILIIAGLITIIGVGKTTKLVADIAVPGSGEALGAAQKVAKAAEAAK